jgi:hypothetical protein
MPAYEAIFRVPVSPHYAVISVVSGDFGWRGFGAYRLCISWVMVRDYWLLCADFIVGTELDNNNSGIAVGYRLWLVAWLNVSAAADRL